MKHPTEIKGYGNNLTLLADDICHLRYDRLQLILGWMGVNLSCDSMKDKRKGRKKLSQKLYLASKLLDKTSREIGKAWNICKPYMERELGE